MHLSEVDNTLITNTSIIISIIISQYLQKFVGSNLNSFDISLKGSVIPIVKIDKVNFILAVYNFSQYINY